MRPMDGSRSFEAHAQEPCSGQGLLRSTVTNVRTSHSDPPGRSQAPRKLQSTTSRLCEKPVDLGRQQQWTLLRKCKGCSLPLALGDSNRFVGLLKEAPEAGQARSKVKPVADRVESCKLFIARAQRRDMCRRVIKRVQDERCTWRRSRRPRLLSLVAHPPTVVVPKQIEELVRQRDLLRQGFSTRVPKDGLGVRRQHPRFDLGAPHACRSTRFGALMSNRNCEMRNVLEFGDASSIAQIGTLLSQGAESRWEVEVVIAGRFEHIGLASVWLERATVWGVWFGIDWWASVFSCRQPHSVFPVSQLTQ